MEPSDPSRPVALITGGGRGIGASIAASLAEGGYDVILTGRNEHQLATTGRRLGAQWIAGDVTDAGTAAAAVEQIVARRGRLDVVVNNAGTAGSGGSLSDVDIENWWEVMKVNVYGPMAFMSAALAHMVPVERGAIFNICSYAAIAPTPGNSAYGASKAALARLTDSVAMECQESGVTLLNVSPGLVDTDMTSGVPIFEGLPPDAWEPAERIGELIVALLDRPDLHTLTGRFVHVRDDIDELFDSIETIEAHDLYRLTMHGLRGAID